MSPMTPGRLVVVGVIEAGKAVRFEVDPELQAREDYHTGCSMYWDRMPVEACTTPAMQRGWYDEQFEDKGSRAYIRALEEAGCPAHWCDAYVPVPLDFETEW